MSLHDQMSRQLSINHIWVHPWWCCSIHDDAIGCNLVTIQSYGLQYLVNQVGLWECNLPIGFAVNVDPQEILNLPHDCNIESHMLDACNHLIEFSLVSATNNRVVTVQNIYQRFDKPNLLHKLFGQVLVPDSSGLFWSYQLA